MFFASARGAFVASHLRPDRDGDPGRRLDAPRRERARSRRRTIPRLIDIPDFIVVVDGPDGRIELANVAAAAFGCSRASSSAGRAAQSSDLTEVGAAPGRPGTRRAMNVRAADGDATIEVLARHRSRSVRATVCSCRLAT
jgi:hypothetical protein